MLVEAADEPVTAVVAVSFRYDTNWGADVRVLMYRCSAVVCSGRLAGHF